MSTRGKYVGERECQAEEGEKKNDLSQAQEEPPASASIGGNCLKGRLGVGLLQRNVIKSHQFTLLAHHGLASKQSFFSQDLKSNRLLEGETRLEREDGVL